MINHISRQSTEFQDFQRRGRQSPYADLFVTLDKVWPNGDPPSTDLAKIVLRKPGSPFSTITVGATGATERVWTSFGTADWSEQIDLDVTAPATRALITEWLRVPCLAPRPDRPPRRRRVRHQETRDELLHGRARDLRVPRVDHRRRRHPPPDPSPGSARPTTRRTNGYQRTATGPTTSCCRDWCSTLSTPAKQTDSPATSPNRRTSSSRPSIATTAYPYTPTSKDCSNHVLCTPSPSAPSHVAET